MNATISLPPLIASLGVLMFVWGLSVSWPAKRRLSISPGFGRSRARYRYISSTRVYQESRRIYIATRQHNEHLLSIALNAYRFSRAHGYGLKLPRQLVLLASADLFASTFENIVVSRYAFGRRVAA